jgi:hypothetical protein
LRGLKGDGEGLEGEGELIAKVELEPTEVAMVFGFEADLEGSVFVEDALGGVGEAVEPFGDVCAVGERGEG